MIDVPVTERRTDRRNCPHCEGTAAGCRSLHWLRAQFCCTACTGDHDRKADR